MKEYIKNINPAKFKKTSDNPATIKNNKTRHKITTWVSAKSKEGTNSSHILKYSYDRVTKELKIVFVSSQKVYIFAEVPPAVYDNFNKSDSKGVYFSSFIKERYEILK